MPVQHGDLVHADRTARWSFRPRLARGLPDAARQVAAREAKILAVARAPGCTAERLVEVFQAAGRHPLTRSASSAVRTHDPCSARIRATIRHAPRTGATPGGTKSATPASRRSSMADHEHDFRRRGVACCRPARAPRRSVRFPGGSARRAGAGHVRLEAFKGEKIEVFLVKSPRGDLLTKYHKEFEDLTGITVGSEMIPEQQQRQKAVIEFNSGNPSFDVIALSYHVQKRQFAKNNWLTDLRPMIADKSLADPISTSTTSPRAASTTPSSRTAASIACRSTSTRGSSIATRSCSTRRASRIRRTSPRCVDAAAKLQRSGQGRRGLRRTRAQERQRAGVVELPAGLRRRLHRHATAS